MAYEVRGNLDRFHIDFGEEHEQKGSGSVERPGFIRNGQASRRKTMTEEELKECKLYIVTHVGECTCCCAGVESESVTVMYRGKVLPSLKIVCDRCERILYTSWVAIG